MNGRRSKLPRRLGESALRESQRLLAIALVAGVDVLRSQKGDHLFTMEVPRRHARTRAIIGDTIPPANSHVLMGGDASRDVARVVSDVSVLCPRIVAGCDN